MNIPATLPSYALIKEVSGLDPDRLRDGSYQREAMDFFSKVVQVHGNTNLSEVYNAIFEARFGKDSLSTSDRFCSPFLCMTVALVAIEDISHLKHCTLNDNLPLGAVSRLVGLLANRVEVDYVQQFENCGELSLDLFIMLYCTEKYNFALKVVMDDNPKAFAKLQQCDPSTAVKALARVPYDPLSNIRVSLPEGSSLSEAEMLKRYKNQVTALYSKEHVALLNPTAPSKIQGRKLEHTTIPSVDHKIALLPGYLELLGKQDNGMLQDFCFLSRMEAAISEDQYKLMVNLMLDFEKAGISRPDILNIATLNYEDLIERFAKTSTLLATDVGQSFKEYSKQAALVVYRAMTPEQRHALYLEQLMTKAVEYGEDPTAWHAQAKLRQVNHLMRQEPRETLEALCTQDTHWNALYRATGDKRYLQKLESQLDRALAEDLGL